MSYVRDRITKMDEDDDDAKCVCGLSGPMASLNKTEGDTLIVSKMKKETKDDRHTHTQMWTGNL